MLASIKNTLAHFSDFYLLPLHVRKLCKKARQRQKTPILIIRYEALGDAIWATAAIRAYKKKYPHHYLVFLTQRKIAAYLSRFQGADTTIGIKECKHDHLSQYFDKVIILSQDEQSKPRHFFYDYCDCLGIPHDALNPIYNTKKTAPRRDRKKIVIHIGPTWPVRSISVDTIKEALRIAANACPLECIQIAKNVKSSDGYTLPEDIAINRMNDTSLEELSDLINDADLFLGVDSGPMHIAAACNVPIVGLFSSTLPETRLPFNHNQSVCSEVECLGCHHTHPRGHSRNNCPNHLACVSAYDPQKIANQIIKTLASSGSSF